MPRTVLHLKCRFLNPLTSSGPQPVHSAGNTTEMPASLFPDLGTVFVKVRGTGRTDAYDMYDSPPDRGVCECVRVCVSECV